MASTYLSLLSRKQLYLVVIQAAEQGQGEPKKKLAK